MRLRGEGAYLKEVLGSCVCSLGSEDSSGLRWASWRAPGMESRRKLSCQEQARD